METIKATFNYFLNVSPGQYFKFYIPLAILICILIIGGMAVYFIYKNKKKTDFAFKRLFKHLSKTLILMGILFAFLLLVRYEAIPYFSMRIWIYLSLLLLLFFAYKYIKIFKIDYPREKENVKNLLHPVDTRKKVYLPNKNKKK